MQADKWWLHQLLAKKDTLSERALTHEIGTNRTRLQQFLYLFRIQDELRSRGIKGEKEG